MGMIKEFRDFAMKGNMIDLAVGIAIGAAFTATVNSGVKDVITPLLGAILGGVNLDDMFIVLRNGAGSGVYHSLQDAKEAGAVTWNLGAFVNNLITFAFVAWALFFVVKGVNKLRSAPKAKMTKDQELLTEIRDLLKSREPEPDTE